MNRFELADHWFKCYWDLHMVQQYTLAEMPQAWLFFKISMAAQQKLDPFDEPPQSQDPA